jgi:Fe-S oxidoreductase/nitrate reductase gamma subunit
MDPPVPGREVFRSLTAPSILAFYALSAAALAVFAYGAWGRLRKYRAGRPAGRLPDIGLRLAAALRALATHSTLRHRQAGAGAAHWLIFWGFVVLFLGTLIIMVDYDMVRLVNPAWRFWRGSFYRWYSATLDVLGAGFVVGLAVMMARRWLARPALLDYTRPDRPPGTYDRAGYVADDRLFLWLLFAIGVTGFLVEGLRIAADRPPFEPWSVVGWQLASLLDLAGVAPLANPLHLATWWVHAVLALGFVAYLPYSKAVHVIVDLGNLALRDPRAGRCLPPVTVEPPGYGTLADLTWKELLDLDACTKCGRCHSVCPARAAGAPLSPRDLILELREHAEASLGGRSWLHEQATRTGTLAGGVIRGETLWACTTCLACMETCPVGIAHVPLIVQMRRRLVADGTLDANLQAVLQKLGRYGNSFGQSERARGRWTQGLGFQVKDARKEPVEHLWFVGDYASYDPSLQGLTRAVARVFQRAGLNFGILYDGERNAGNDVRRVGEEGLYQALVERNLTALRQARFQEIVTTDPHTYNTLRFEYPAFGESYRVRHYTEVVADLLAQGRLRAVTRLRGVVTYHDPCYLSRYAEVTEPPREILRALGLTVVEMERSRAASFCCGAGGGRIWMSTTRTPGVPTPAEQRIEEALAIPDVRWFVVACPKDVTMYRDALKTAGREGRLQVRELIELVEEALGPAPEATGAGGRTA